MNSRRLKLCLIVIVLSLVSCSKVTEYLRNNKDGDIRYCNIKKIQFYFSGQREYVFSYNAAGNPVSAVVDQTGTTVPSRYFTYDNRNRLVRQIGFYEPGNTYFDFYSVYLHDTRNRISRDTSWWWGSIQNGKPISQFGYNVTDYTYDQWDRIIKATISYPLDGWPPLELLYDYNEDGNLVDEDAVYDDKISPSRTNKIWMFINRNYSVNNGFKAKTYNKNKLPLEVDLDAHFFSNHSFFNLDMPQAKIEYMCD